jgi:RimJ/RimL family protein N-acetyltransferase
MALLQKVLATKMKADFSLPINASMIRLFPQNRSTSKMQKADSRGNHRLVVLSAQAGYQQAAESQLGYFQAQLDELANYIESFEAMYSEPLIFDDSLRVGIEEFLKQIVLACEILILLDEASAVAGICIFNPVRKDINYEIIGWVAPKYRVGIANQRFVLQRYREEVLPYAWNRLKIVKLSSTTHVQNRAAIRFNRNVGLEMTGHSRKEMMVQGELCDALRFECINPAIPLHARVIRRGERIAVENVIS